MLEHSQQRAVGPWRRWTFRIWIALTIVLGAYIVIILPFFRDERVGQFLTALPVPFVMFTLLVIGLSWLLWLLTATRRRRQAG
jgi:hypothetical protein